MHISVQYINYRKIALAGEENKLPKKMAFFNIKRALAAILFFETGPKLFPEKFIGPRTYPENLKRLAQKLRLVER